MDQQQQTGQQRQGKDKPDTRKGSRQAENQSPVNSPGSGQTEKGQQQYTIHRSNTGIKLGKITLRNDGRGRSRLGPGVVCGTVHLHCVISTVQVFGIISPGRCMIGN